MYTDTNSSPSAAFRAQDTPKAVTPTTPPAGTYIDVTHVVGNGMLLYWPENNGLIALWPEEWLEFRQEADYHNEVVEKLQQANREVTEASLNLREAQKSAAKPRISEAEQVLQQKLDQQNQASEAVRAAVKPLTDLKAGDPLKMVELLPLTLATHSKKSTPIYVKSDRIKKVLADKRVYLIDGEAERRKPNKLFKGGALDTEEVKRRLLDQVQDKAGFQKKWKLAPDGQDQYADIFSDWARVMNGDIKTFIERQQNAVEKHFNLDPKDPHRNIDLNAEAQLMRWAAGAGLEVNFNPFRGNLHDKRDRHWADRAKRGLKSGAFGIKANADASFAIAEGRVSTALYFPHYAGWHATPEVLGQDFDLGYFRFYGDIALYGTAGASLAVDLDVEATYTAGKQGLRGTPKSKGGMKVRAGGGGELAVFAGIKAGVDAVGAFQWLSPEGDLGGGRPRKVNIHEAVPEYRDVATIKPGVAALAGAAAQGAFKIGHMNGKFVITAKLGACLGLGGEGKLTFEVGTETIGDFFKCLAYQLKDADYHQMMEVYTKEAYQAYGHILYIVVATGQDVRAFAHMAGVQIGIKYNEAVSIVRRAGVQAIRRIADQLRVWGWIAYMPPEGKGAILASVAEIAANRELLAANPGLHEEVAWIVSQMLATHQTPREKHEVLQHMTLALGDKVDVARSEATLRALVAGTPYSDCLTLADIRLAAAQPIKGRPFLRNNESDFVVATLGFNHPLYA